MNIGDIVIGQEYEVNGHRVKVLEIVREREYPRDDSRMVRKVKVVYPDGTTLWDGRQNREPGHIETVMARTIGEEWAPFAARRAENAAQDAAHNDAIDNLTGAFFDSPVAPIVRSRGWNVSVELTVDDANQLADYIAQWEA